MLEGLVKKASFKARNPNEPVMKTMNKFQRIVHGWEGNRRSGIGLVMRRRLKWFIYPRAQGIIREMRTPPTF